MGRPGPLTSVEEGMSLHRDTGVLDFVGKRLRECKFVSCPTCVQGGCPALLAERELWQEEEGEWW